MKIKVHGLCKEYLLKNALKDVSLEFEGGKLHAILGQNGAGKSTFSKILSGNIRPSSGDIFLDDKKVFFKCPRDALKHSIALVNQTPFLATELSAKENINLILKGKKVSSVEITDLKNKWCPHLNLNAKVKDLGGNFRFYTSLLGILLRKTNCIILDEPSAFLEADERKNLYENLRCLCNEGKLIIVITHSKAEAGRWADTVTIFNEGKVFHHFESSKEYNAYLKYLEENKIEKINSLPHQMMDVKVTPCLIAEKIKVKPKNKALFYSDSLKINYGEITVLSGMGQAALSTAEDFFSGLQEENISGLITFFDKTCENKKNKIIKINLKSKKFNSTFLRKHKAAIVPSDRNYRAANPQLTVEEILNVYKKWPSKKFTWDLIKKADVKITPYEKVSALSGGMLQRLILERELSLNPSLIILANPMQGLDIDAQGNLCHRLLELKNEGKAIFIIGSLDFPLSLCQRVYALEDGTTSLTYEKGKSYRHEKREEEKVKEVKLIEPPELVKDDFLAEGRSGSNEERASVDVGGIRPFVEDQTTSAEERADVDVAPFVEDKTASDEEVTDVDGATVDNVVPFEKDKTASDEEGALSAQDDKPAPAEDVAPFVKDKAGSDEEGALSAQDEPAPAEDVAHFVEDKVVSNEEVAQPAQDEPAPAEDVAPFVEDKTGSDEEGTLSAQDEPAPAEDVAPFVEDKAASDEEGPLSAQDKFTTATPLPLEEISCVQDVITPEEMAALLPSYNTPIQEKSFSDLYVEKDTTVKEDEVIAAFEVPVFESDYKEEEKSFFKDKKSFWKKNKDNESNLKNFKFDYVPILKNHDEKNRRKKNHGENDDGRN